MKLLGHRLHWYFEKYARFDYRAARGNSLTNMFFGRIKGAGWLLMWLGATDNVFTKWFNLSIIDTMPWWGMIILAVGQVGIEYSVGTLDYLKLKFAQIQNEVSMRDRINPWENEKMDRQRDDRKLLLYICEKLGITDKKVGEIRNKKYESFIEKKVSPETFKENHDTLKFETHNHQDTENYNSDCLTCNPGLVKFNPLIKENNLCEYHGKSLKYCEDCFGIIMSGNFQNQTQEAHNKGINQGWKDGYQDGLSDGRREKYNDFKKCNCK